MKKMLFLIFGLMGIFVFIVSCDKKATTKSMGTGKTMVLALETNPSTGYDWVYEFLQGEDKAEIVLDHDVIEANNDLNLMGAPSTRKYYFVAKKPGTQLLTFTYKRDWEGGEVAYDVVYELSVDKDLNISYLSKMKGKVESDKEITEFPNPTFE